ncbi:unnamed protein product [Vitrella brassicaformis CCMP3155]|uniref:FAD-binding domain-containing protein n=3 Tax=Vitrella brassicaformis TaxID=1169539 RepID=A0A0G4F2D4_VITBC|nr:unnamed protein product [Vitrella brassicaformis CCMP3155]|eukprot:CEM05851.1 unnamed protein product [Vitrella brassicaformis CCMP3155]
MRQEAIAWPPSYASPPPIVLPAARLPTGLRERLSAIGKSFQQGVKDNRERLKRILGGARARAKGVGERIASIVPDELPPPPNPLVASLPSSVDVLVVGSGLSGAALMRGLTQAGVDCCLVEASPRLREGGTAIGLWTQAWRALSYLRVDNAMRAGYVLNKEVCLASKEGGVLVDFNVDECANGPHEFRQVLRGQLLRELLSGVPRDRIFYSAEVEEVLEGTGSRPVLVTLKDGRQIRARVVVGADGIRSSVRASIAPREPPPRYAGYKAFRGVARLRPTFPLSMGGMPWEPSLGRGKSVLLKEGVVGQVFGEGVRFGSAQISEDRVYWFVCFNALAGDVPAISVNATGRKAYAARLVEGWGHQVYQLVQATPAEDIVLSDIRHRFPSFRPWGKGRVTLIGDSAHPMTPNLGQGGAAAIEDAVELCSVLTPILGRRPPATQTSSPSSPSAGRIASIGMNIGPIDFPPPRQPQPFEPRIDDEADIDRALRRFERNRLGRIAFLSMKAWVYGVALQIALEPICALRNFLVPILLAPNTLLRANFLDHTDWKPPTPPPLSGGAGLLEGIGETIRRFQREEREGGESG